MGLFGLMKCYFGPVINFFRFFTLAEYSAHFNLIRHSSNIYVSFKFEFLSLFHEYLSQRVDLRKNVEIFKCSKTRGYWKFIFHHRIFMNFKL